MDAAGLDRAVLVGCSRAGSIAIDTALEFPDRVSGLVWVCGGLSGFDGEETPEELAAGSREEELSDAKDWAAAVRRSTWRCGSTASGSPRAGLPPTAREAVRRMAYETYVQEKPYGDTIVLDPPAIGRLAEVRVPTARDDRRPRHPVDTGLGRSCCLRDPRRPPDRPARRRPHAEPRAAGVVHRDAARVPRRGRCRDLSPGPRVLQHSHCSNAALPAACAGRAPGYEQVQQLHDSTRDQMAIPARRTTPTPAVEPSDDSGQRRRSPQATTRSIAMRIAGRRPRSCEAYCGYFARSASIAAA